MLEDVGPEPSRYPSRRAQRALHRAKARVHAYERFLEGMEIGAIAKEVGLSRQRIYALAKSEDWPGRRARLQTHALLENGASAQAMDLAVAELQSKLSVRIIELDALCRKHNLHAIKLWGQWAGLGSKYEIGEGTQVIEVHNDLSDRRQVMVVQESPALEIQETHKELEDHVREATP